MLLNSIYRSLDIPGKKQFIGKYIYTIRPVEWLRNTSAMLTQIGAFNTDPEKNKDLKHFGIVVTPWLATDVPWFSIGVGLFLARKGNAVTFILDDLRFGVNPVRFSFIVFCIKRVLKLVSRRCRVIELSKYKTRQGPVSPGQKEFIDKMASLNAVHALRGEIISNGRQSYIDKITKQLVHSCAAIDNYFRSNHMDVVFIPGGIYGSSGLWGKCAQDSRVRVASYDGGVSPYLLIATDGIAAHLDDIPRAFHMLESSRGYERERPYVIAAAQEELQKRKEGVDRFKSQIISKTDMKWDFADGVLIALNASWDSAALGLHVVFENSAQWIVESIRWILDNTDRHIIVRQHPAERHSLGRSSEDYRRLLFENFKVSSRIHFVAADEQVNTYEIMDKVSTVLVYTSTIGVEAAAIGKIVVTPSKSYYSSLGFVWSAKDRESYFKHIRHAVQGTYQLSQEKKENALCCYYLTQCCNWINSRFNPAGFADWGRASLESSYSSPPVQMVLTALQSNIPIAILKHNDNMTTR